MNKYIDLHLHLDGAITLEIARKLAGLQGIDLPEADEELSKMLTVPESCCSLNDFLKCFELPLSLLQTKEGLSEAVYLVAENIRLQNVVYAEIRFAPQLHVNKGLSQEETILAALEGIKRTSLKANLILCLMRGNDNRSANLETLELASKYLVKDGGVVAIDLAGAEGLFPTSDYKDIFADAKQKGIPFTIHAGEADGPESVKQAINFGANRIGHGVRIFEDENVVSLVKEKGIFLEMCPTSNRQTHAVFDMSKYPLMDYLKKGIKVTVNTDDMAIEGTTIAQEYELLKNKYKLTSDDIKTVYYNSVDAAFTNEETKSKLRELLALDIPLTGM